MRNRVDRTIINWLHNGRKLASERLGFKLTLCQLLDQNFVANHLYNERLSNETKQLLERINKNE